MIAKSTKEFQNNVLKKMTFTAYPKDNYILYTNENKKNLGYFIKYTREGYYDFGIGDYTIPNDFSISFEHNEELIKFGTVYSGETQFEIENNPISSFTPSSFFVNEKGLKGKQSWKKGQLSSLYLESKILECIALINLEIQSSPENVFTNQLNYGHVTIGKNRTVTLTASDVNAIQKAHDILTNEFCNPPTISALSKTIFLNEQKLKAGFSSRYHMSISQYTTSLKMALAENLLSTTELSIDEIAKKVGYNHSGNFIKMFKKLHGKTPLSFRKLKN